MRCTPSSWYRATTPTAARSVRFAHRRDRAEQDVGAPPSRDAVLSTCNSGGSLGRYHALGHRRRPPARQGSQGRAQEVAGMGRVRGARLPGGLGAPVPAPVAGAFDDQLPSWRGGQAPRADLAEAADVGCLDPSVTHCQRPMRASTRPYGGLVKPAHTCLEFARSGPNTACCPLREFP